MNHDYSVLMSVYSKEQPMHLTQSIESMFEQTLKPNEIVLVKDGPLTTELDEIIKKYENKNPNLFKVISLKENVGLGKALDIGIEVCSNELIARMDADDISINIRCEKQIKYFEDTPDLSIVGTWIDEFSDDPKNIISSRVVPAEHSDIKIFMKRRSPFNHPTVMYKKSEVIRCGGYGKMRRKQDLDLFSRMVNNGCITANIEESLLLFRSNEDNFKRRKSWTYCKSYIDVQLEIWKRGHCSFMDLVYVVTGQLFLFMLPISLLKVVSNNLLRKGR